MYSLSWSINITRNMILGKKTVFHVTALSETDLSLQFSLVVLFEFSVINNVEKHQHSSES